MTDDYESASSAQVDNRGGPAFMEIKCKLCGKTTTFDVVQGGTITYKSCECRLKDD